MLQASQLSNRYRYNNRLNDGAKFPARPLPALTPLFLQRILATYTAVGIVEGGFQDPLAGYLVTGRMDSRTEGWAHRFRGHSDFVEFPIL